MHKIFIRFAFLLLTGLLTGCTADVGISESSIMGRRYYDVADFSANVMNISTGNLLNNYQLTDIYRHDPDLLISKLEQLYLQEHDSDVIAALADTALQIGYRLQADADKSSSYFLAAAVYSAFYLKKLDNCSELYSEKRLRLIRLHNLAAAELFLYLKSRDLERKSGYELVMPGSGRKVFFKSPEFEVPVSEKYIADFTPCANYRTKNLTHNTRVFGLGVPLVASLLKNARDEMGSLLPGFPLAVTMVMDIDFIAGSGRFDCSLRYIYSRTTEKVTLGERSFPLAADYSTPLAKAAAMPRKMNFISRTINVAEAANYTGLFLFEPYDHNRIPIVFVHGLLSDMATWAQMFNTLLHDPHIRKNYQFLGFAYSSGNPVFRSGAVLRSELLALRKKLVERNCSTEKFDRMVLVGHSMGGLLCRLQITTCTTQTAASAVGVEKLNALQQDISEDVINDIVRDFNFAPVDPVKRVIFMAVPHRGSEIARSIIGSIGASLINLPLNLVKRNIIVMNTLLTTGKLSIEGIGGNTGIDNLRPDAPVLKILNSLPIAENVQYHSIIGNDEKSFTPGGTDGVVPYWSSHLDNTCSELVVKADHSVHRVPLAIQEVRRILKEHSKVVKP